MADALAAALKKRNAKVSGSGTSYSRNHPSTTCVRILTRFTR